MTKEMKYFLLLVFLLGSSFPLLAQEEESGDYDYDKEVLFGINKNTNGGLIGGISLKIGSRIDDNLFQFFNLELANVKNPKEVRYPTPLGNTYIFGKSNYLYAIRPQYGREIIAFKKAPHQGVQISFLTAIGPTIGLLAPYYIEYATSRTETMREQYDPSVHQSIFNILGPGRLFEGIGESEIAFGANAKAAINFEFGFLKSNVTGLELGYQFEGFTKEIPLMPTTENRQIFQSAYVTLYYGFRR
ncbi:hypothetical protein [Cyclobacterium qasimii]|uniref:Outer membrane protein beta-barrel domain-containing protein n=2 Tax=Cyclobacterium qasimii TaxID=1350429 RepID=S7VHD8_9BACT|nr:hypothetical protein [Cyclobacterium qasimii]EPR68952.1 hypothetical protein ADICYQ_2039 [Cyclobacterium qasimii M12-11B]GEO23903.1 hypothetical protein CQA01_44370 [Cyclobacterium qasimii]